jgi:hypothetical protein
MPTRHERVHLSQGSDGKTTLFLIQLQFLQGNNITSLLIPCSEDNTVGTFFDLI